VRTVHTPVATTHPRKDTMSQRLYDEAETTRRQIHPDQDTATLFSAATTRVVKVVAEGDSWYDYTPPNDVVASLRRGPWPGRRYDIRGRPAAGAYLNDMVYHPRQLAETFQAIREHQPEVLLFSGGGNDIAGPELFDLLWHRKAGGMAAGQVVNNVVLGGLINEIFAQAYRDFIDAVRQCAADSGLPRLPIIVHGYDYAIPDGRGWLGGAGPLPGPWLDPSLRRKGWDRTTDAVAREAAIRQLIDALNLMLAGLAATIPDLHYVDLRGTLARADWANELHPDAAGFRRVTARIEQMLRIVCP